jgi:hypothetical protein
MQDYFVTQNAFKTFRKVSPKSEFGLRKVPGLYLCLIFAQLSEKPSDLPFSLKTSVFIGVSAREVLSGDLP